MEVKSVGHNFNREPQPNLIKFGSAVSEEKI